MAEEALPPETTEQLRGGQGFDVGHREASLKQGLLDQEAASFISENSSETAPSTSEFKHPRIADGDVLCHPWAFNSAVQFVNPEFALLNSYLLDSGCFASSMPLLLYPAPSCRLVPAPSHDQQLQHGGLFAAPCFPYAGPVTFVPLGGLVPLCYNAPLGVTSLSEQYVPMTSGQAPNTAPTEIPVAAEAPGEAQEGLRQRHPAIAAVAQGPGAQRQDIRRFRVGFQLDLLLILKLAVVVFFFNQDGSMDRLLLLSFLAALVYMYQTGALTPTLRWILQQFRMPPRQALHHPPNDQAQHGVERGGGDVVDDERNAGAIVPAAGAENEPIHAAAPAEGAIVAGAAIAAPVGELPAQGPTWWGFLKEIQILVVGFVTSLLPGFQNPE
ncbi:hypothetical protein O6H91_17G084600 [Diphasiastrum complanatum]|uniref:Uncharacterized protein n=1 Tax=Diphasiastrum complanatum TaxID=34168 RepID=A0ACC2B8U2_DIPCM|nr:hypothetical protein O6H91_17G084600 [Diphasiastrum complanatum]